MMGTRQPGQPGQTGPEGPAPDRYVQPDWFGAHVLNPSVRWLTGRGVSLLGTRILEVRGRTSGLQRSTVVNVLECGGDVYLVAPRGATQWVRNLRVAGSGRLRLGRRVSSFSAIEVADEAKVPVLQTYLRRWWWEVGSVFEGVDRHADGDRLAEIAPDFPVFRIQFDD